MTNTYSRRNRHFTWGGALGLLALAVFALWIVPGLEAAGVDAAWAHAPFPEPASAPAPAQPLAPATNLVVAALIGATLAAVRRHFRPDHRFTTSMAWSFVLACVAGTLLMTLIGASLPRAFGVVGSASVVRFGTSIDDPRDGTALFLLMALGMAAGVGAYEVAVVGSLLLVGSLVVLSPSDTLHLPRSMQVAVIAEGHALPTSHIQRVFARHDIQADPIEIAPGEQTVMRYQAVLTGDRTLEEVSRDLIDAGRAGIRSVSWDAPKHWI